MATDDFDVIIVGGGTAGLVLANRLTEDKTVRVLVLEAGEDISSDGRVTTPLHYPLLMGSEADWNAETEPQVALNNRKIRIPYGRALGGSSSINGQAFVPTSKAGIDAWGQLGNPSWSWEVLAPYLRKCFTLNQPAPGGPIHSQLHLDYIEHSLNGTDGPIQCSFPSEIQSQLPSAWIETLTYLDQGARGDPFSGQFTGTFSNAASIDPVTRQRSDANSAYLKPVQDRVNLKVLTGAHVQKIILEGSDAEVTATGVQYILNGILTTATAKSEVILSAGVMHSPKILELSGIGDPELLTSLGIPVVVANENVGENLQDHPMTGLSFEVKDGVKTIDDLFRQDPAATEAAQRQYAESRSGPLTVGGVFSYALLGLQNNNSEFVDLIERYTSPNDPKSLPSALMEFHTSLLRNPHEATATFCMQPSQGNFCAEAGSSLLSEQLLPGNYCTIAVYVLQPLSRGSVHIRSANPSDAVKVDPQYLAHPLDLELLARHMTYVSKIISTEPFKSLLKPDGRRNANAPTDLTDLESMKEYIRKTTLSGWHPTSTCAMLPREKGGVVNDRLVVHGTRNLRLVDASIFPITARANPVATVYAVAERAADLIKDDLAEGRAGRVKAGA